MKKNKIILTIIAFCFCISIGFADNIRLKLKEPLDGERYLSGEKLDLSREEVVLKIDGKVVSVKREDIDTIKFLPSKKTNVPSGQLSSENKSQVASSKPAKASAGSDEVEPKKLGTPENRKQFKLLQEQMMAQYKGRPGYDEAIRQQKEMFEALANGTMSLEELQAKAGEVSTKAKSYNAQETSEYPELQLLLQQLDSFTKEK
jgi:hypothetical protein